MSSVTVPIRAVVDQIDTEDWAWLPNMTRVLGGTRECFAIGVGKSGLVARRMCAFLRSINLRSISSMPERVCMVSSAGFKMEVP